MSLDDIAGRAGASDLFVLDTIEDGRLFNVDGVGRGAGWTGNLTLSPTEEPFLARAVEESVVTVDGPHPGRVFGPYWARRAAAVSHRQGVVVFGGDRLVLDPSTLARLAAHARATSARVVRPSKLEADQAEIDQARSAVAEIDEDCAEWRATRLAAVAATALGCEYAAVYLPELAPIPFMADQGWRPAASPDEVTAAILPLWHAARRGLVVEQNVSRSAWVHRPLAWDDGVVSLAATPLGAQGAAGVLVVAHTGIRPRGFTDLCAKVLQTVGEAGSELLAPT